MIHFYLHYGAPRENSYLYHLKRYHNHHHFEHHENGGYLGFVEGGVNKHGVLHHTINWILEQQEFHGSISEPKKYFNYLLEKNIFLIITAS